MDLEKEKWFQEINMMEHLEPVKYFYTIEHCTFHFPEHYIKNTSLENLEIEYEENKKRLEKFKSNRAVK